jgi:hypothetical protein
MKAEEIIQLIRKSITPSEQIEHLENYARIQIENDRERIIQKIETTMDYPHYSLRIIDETPITLD